MTNPVTLKKTSKNVNSIATNNNSKYVGNMAILET